MILVKAVLSKAQYAMVFTLLGMVTDANWLQFANALLPILVTLEGILTDVMFVQLLKAWLPMLVTSFSTTTVLMLERSAYQGACLEGV